MISRRTALLNILVLGSVLGAGLPAFGEARRPSTIQKFDTDNDGTLDLNEVKKAGAPFSTSSIVITTALSIGANCEAD
jgi:hypothetical protein